MTHFHSRATRKDKRTKIINVKAIKSIIYALDISNVKTIETDDEVEKRRKKKNELLIKY